MAIYMDDIQIQKVEGKKALKDFIKLPWKIYEEDPHWVPPLIKERKDFFNPKKNPFYRHSQIQLFLAIKSGKPVGRISALINHNHNRFHEEKTGFFGFFEAQPQYPIAQNLLDQARSWLKARGMEVMRGPMNFSTNDECGILVEGFDSSPMIMMPYNPSCYQKFMENYGLKKAKDLYAYLIDHSQQPPERMRKVAERVKEKEGLHIRQINLKRFEEEIKLVKQIYNQAWSKNWGFVPMTDDEFNHLAKDLKRFMVPELVLIAEVNGEPAGFSMALPDYNQALKRINGRLFPWGLFKLLWYSRRIDATRVLTMGVVHKYQKRGIDLIFYLETFDRGVKKGYKRGELSWILEDNLLMNRALNDLGARIYKRYRIYEIKL